MLHVRIVQAAPFQDVNVTLAVLCVSVAGLRFSIMQM